MNEEPLYIETFTTKKLLYKFFTPEIFATIFTNFTDKQLGTFLHLTSAAAITKERQRYSNGAYAKYKNLVGFS